MTEIPAAVMSKARMSEELKALVEKARARYDAMSPDERRAHDEAQRASWVRGMTARCEHGVIDFEQCPDCCEKYRLDATSQEGDSNG